MYEGIHQEESYVGDKKLGVKDVFFLLSFVAIYFGINEVAILFAVYIFLSHSRKLILPPKVLYLLLPVLLSGSLISFFSVINESIAAENLEDIFFRIRFFFIRIIYAFAVGIYLYRQNFLKILHIVYVLAIANIIAGLVQLFGNFLNNEFLRLNMLSSEPSAAAMFYAFSGPLLLLYTQYFPNVKKYVWFFLLFGLLLLSKAQILIFILWIILYLFKAKRKVLIFPLAVILLIIIYPYFFEVKQINSMYRLVNVLISEGVYGLNPSNQIWTSFTVRISSWIAAAEIFITNPFGVGFGHFHQLYIEFMRTNELGRHVTGIEIENILTGGNMYATPKSAFMELVVSAGLFFIIPFIFISRRVMKYKSDFLIKLSFWSVVLTALMVELSPFLTFLVFILVLQLKYRDIVIQPD